MQFDIRRYGAVYSGMMNKTLILPLTRTRGILATALRGASVGMGELLERFIKRASGYPSATGCHGCIQRHLHQLWIFLLSSHPLCCSLIT